MGETTKMKRWILGLVLTGLASTIMADQLVLTGQVKEGTFQKYENGRFEFVTAQGRFVKERADRVTKLVLSSPMKVAYLTTDSKREETAELKGYDKKAFTFARKNLDLVVALSKIRTIGRADEGESSDAGSRYPIPEFDTDSLSGGDLSPAQQSSLESFKAAKKTFDAFVAESSALVAEMDKTTGVRRENLLNQLRQRKNDEQPLKKALINAYNALADAFPQSSDDPPAQPTPSRR